MTVGACVTAFKNIMTTIDLRIDIGELSLGAPYQRPLPLSIFLSLAKKSTQLQIDSAPPTPSGSLLIDRTMTIDCTQLDMNRHKYCLLFLYHIKEMGRKTLLGNIPLNIARSRDKGSKTYKIVECADPNATLSVAITVTGNVEFSETPSQISTKDRDMSGLNTQVIGRAFRSRQEFSEAPNLRAANISQTKSSSDKAAFERSASPTILMNLLSPQRANLHSPPVLPPKAPVNYPFTPSGIKRVETVEMGSQELLNPQTNTIRSKTVQDEPVSPVSPIRIQLSRDPSQTKIMEEIISDRLSPVTKLRKTGLTHAPQTVGETVAAFKSTSSIKEMHINRVISIGIKQVKNLQPFLGSRRSHARLPHPQRDHSVDGDYSDISAPQMPTINVLRESHHTSNQQFARASEIVGEDKLRQVQQECEMLTLANQKVLQQEATQKNKTKELEKGREKEVKKFQSQIEQLQERVNSLQKLNIEANEKLQLRQKRLQESQRREQMYLQMSNDVKAKNKEYKDIIQELRMSYNNIKTIPEEAEDNLGSPMLAIPPSPKQRLNRVAGGNSLRQIKEIATGPVSKARSDYQFSGSRPRMIDKSAEQKVSALSGGKISRAGSIKANKIVHFAQDDSNENSSSIQPPEREESLRDDRSTSNIASYYGHIRPKDRSVNDSGKEWRLVDFMETPSAELKKETPAVRDKQKERTRSPFMGSKRHTPPTVTGAPPK